MINDAKNAELAFDRFFRLSQKSASSHLSYQERQEYSFLAFALKKYLSGERNGLREENRNDDQSVGRV